MNDQQKAIEELISNIENNIKDCNSIISDLDIGDQGRSMIVGQKNAYKEILSLLGPIADMKQNDSQKSYDIDNITSESESKYSDADLESAKMSNQSYNAVFQYERTAVCDCPNEKDVMDNCKTRCDTKGYER